MSSRNQSTIKNKSTSSQRPATLAAIPLLPDVPVRIQRMRVKGWKMPENTVSVTRPGTFGNPFTVKEAQDAGYEDGRKMALFGFKEWLSEKGNDFNNLLPEKRKKLLENMHKLKGKNLACFCKEGEPCHADVLLELANR